MQLRITSILLIVLLAICHGVHEAIGYLLGDHNYEIPEKNEQTTIPETVLENWFENSPEEHASQCNERWAAPLKPCPATIHSEPINP